MQYIPDEKLCRKCGHIKPLNRFHVQRRGLYGKSSQCIDCQNAARNARSARAPGKHATYQRAWRMKNRDLDISNKMKYAYGITLADYRAMFEAQKGCCAICGKPHVQPLPDAWRTRERLHIDHCHESGLVRGLLCGNCNLGLGNLQHSVEILSKAITYLRASQTNS